MKVNFSKIKLCDIEGKEIKGANLHKIIAHLLWQYVRNLDLVETAQLIHKGKPVDLRTSEVKELRALIVDPKSQVMAFAQKAILDFMDKAASKKE